MTVQIQPKVRILDIYGSFVREFGGWLSISALVELMAEFDVEPQSVRSATARLKGRGLVVPERRDGVAGYKLTPVAAEILEDGDRRIFRDPGNAPDRTWVIALFSVPESKRSRRYVIRSRLTRLGFAQGPSGSWFAPSSVVPETVRMLHREKLSDFVSLWNGEYLGNEDLRTVVADAWDLDGIREGYEEFIRIAEKVDTSRGPETDNRRAIFVDYLNVIAQWRPLPYLDPGLYESVTPDDWPANEARAMFQEINAKLKPIAMQHCVATALRTTMTDATSAG